MKVAVICLRDRPYCVTAPELATLKMSQIRKEFWEDNKNECSEYLYSIDYWTIKEVELNFEDGVYPGYNLEVGLDLGYAPPPKPKPKLSLISRLLAKLGLQFIP